MTKRQALEEIKKILDDYVKKSDKIIRNAKQNGIWLMGLDSNNFRKNAMKKSSRSFQ